MCEFTNEKFQLKVTWITGKTELLSEQLFFPVAPDFVSSAVKATVVIISNNQRY